MIPKRSRLVLMGILLSVFPSLVCAQQAERYSHTGDAVITGVRIIDGLGNKAIENQDIIIVDGKIAAIGPSGLLRISQDALKIDGEGLTAMPGLIDMHIHLQGGWAHGNVEGEKYAIRYDDEAIQQRLNGYMYAGVTTLFEMGNDYDFALKNLDRINSGEMMGPRFFTAALPWSQAPSGWDALDTGGAGQFNISNKVDDFETLGPRLGCLKTLFLG